MRYTVKKLVAIFSMSICANLGNIFSDPIAAFTPLIVTNSNGDAVAIWQGYENDDQTIRGATMAAGGTVGWSTPTTISGTLTGNTLSDAPASLTINSNGDAVIIWSSFDFENYVYRVATQRLHGLSSWDTNPNVISDTVTPEDAAFFDQEVTLDETGNIIALWTASFNSTTSTRGATATISQVASWDNTNNPVFTLDPPAP